MGQKIKDKVVVITGASSGIGRATALALADKGAIVVGAARREEPLESLVEQCRQRGGKALAVETDVTDFEAVQRLADQTVEQFGRLDVWFNNAGVSLFGRIEEVPLEVYRKVVETNFFGYVHGARAALPYFREQGGGMLINNGSMLSKGGAPYLSAYAASKFAVYGMAESLRQELLDTDIEVCTLMPASIDTPIFQNAANYTGRAVKPMDPVYPVEKVSNAVIKLMAKPEKEVYVGHSGRMLGAMHKVSPSLYTRFNARQVDKDHFQERPAPPSKGSVMEPRPQWTTATGGWRNGGLMDKKAVRALAFAGVALTIPVVVGMLRDNGGQGESGLLSTLIPGL